MKKDAGTTWKLKQFPGQRETFMPTQEELLVRAKQPAEDDIHETPLASDELPVTFYSADLAASSGRTCSTTLSKVELV